MNAYVNVWNHCQAYNTKVDPTLGVYLTPHDQTAAVPIVVSLRYRYPISIKKRGVARKLRAQYFCACAFHARSMI